MHIAFLIWVFCDDQFGSSGVGWFGCIYHLTDFTWQLWIVILTCSFYMVAQIRWLLTQHLRWIRPILYNTWQCSLVILVAYLILHQFLLESAFLLLRCVTFEASKSHHWGKIIWYRMPHVIDLKFNHILVIGVIKTTCVKSFVKAVII